MTVAELKSERNAIIFSSCVALGKNQSLQTYISKLFDKNITKAPEMNIKPNISNIYNIDYMYFDDYLGARKLMTLLRLHHSGIVTDDPMLTCIQKGYRQVYNDVISSKKIDENFDLSDKYSSDITSSEVYSIAMYLSLVKGIEVSVSVLDTFKRVSVPVSLLKSTEGSIKDKAVNTIDYSTMTRIKDRWWPNDKSKCSLAHLMSHREFSSRKESLGTISDMEDLIKLALEEDPNNYVDLLRDIIKLEEFHKADVTCLLLKVELTRLEVYKIIEKLMYNTHRRILDLTGIDAVIFTSLVLLCNAKKVALSTKESIKLLDEAISSKAVATQMSTKVNVTETIPSLLATSEYKSKIEQLEKVLADKERKEIKLLKELKDNQVSSKELASLRTMAYNFGNISEITDMDSSNTFNTQVSEEEVIRYIESFKVGLVGGHYNFLDKIKAKLPSVFTVDIKDRSHSPISKLLNQDVVIIYPYHLGHRDSGRVYSLLENTNIPCINLPPNVNMEIVIYNIYRSLKDLKLRP